MKKKETRDEKLIRGYLNNGFTFKGVHYKPLSARTLLLLERVQSPFYHGGNNLKGLIDFLYISSHDSADVLKLINDDTFEAVIYDFADTFSPEDLNDLGEIVSKQNEDIGAAMVEVRNDDSEKK